MRAFALMLTGALSLLAACSDSPVEPSPADVPAELSSADVAGSYEATTLTVDQDGSTTDALAHGASLTVTLVQDGTTEGSFVVPGTLSESGQEERHDLEGTWTLQGESVSFDHPADTFLRDMSLRVEDGRLEGEETFGSETVRVILERT